MEYVKLCDSDYRFMCVVWEHARSEEHTSELQSHA